MLTNESDYILIGRKADGAKVYVKARFELLRDDLDEAATWRETVSHNQTTERLRVAFNGVVVAWNGSISRHGTWTGVGQCANELLELTTLESGWKVGDVVKLHEIWNRWHLNDMRAGCEHQHPTGDRPLDTTPPCPITGYKYGSQWLYESIPFEVFSMVSDAFLIEPPAPGSRA
jgi:hypothetical protein